MMKYCLSPRDFQRAQAIFHCIPRIKSQYSHSQLPLLVNIFFYQVRELALFSCIGFLRWPNMGPYTDPYWASSTGKIFSRIANLRTLAWQFQKFTRKCTLSRREYCTSYFSVFHCQVIENVRYILNIVCIYFTIIKQYWSN